MIQKLKILEKFLKFSLNSIIIFTSIIITLLILFLILARYVLGWSVVGVLELATLSAIWLYMCGAVIAARNHQHLTVNIVSLSLKDLKFKIFHKFFVSLIIVVLNIFFLKLAFDMVEWSMKRPQTTAALSIPLIIPQFAIVFGAICCFLYSLRDLIKSFLELTKLKQNKD